MVNFLPIFGGINFLVMQKYTEIPEPTAEKIAVKPTIQLFVYNAENYRETDQVTTDNLPDFSDPDSCYWLNVHGISDQEEVQKICQRYGIHPLVAQDIVDTRQRTKFREYEDYSFFTVKSILPLKGFRLAMQQLSFVFGRNYLISFQEKRSNYFTTVRHKIRNGDEQIRSKGSDFLLFSLFDLIIDNYYKTDEDFERKIDRLGRFDMHSNPEPEIISVIESFKKEIYIIRKSLLPLSEFVNKLQRDKFPFIEKKHVKYFYDLKDSCMELLDDFYQMEMKLNSHINLFFSIQGHRMNDIMRTLTIMSTIFIPLTFIVGIYGTNFEYIPELHFRYAYFVMWGGMVLIAIVMLILFRRRKWF